jgi:fructose-bisphosphate aldolase, class II
MKTVTEIVKRACASGFAVPGFNVPYLPMVEPVVRAVIDEAAFALVETARLEWIKFGSQGPAAVAAEFAKWRDPDHVRLHLDHVPVIDEDDQRVDYLPIFEEALTLGYESVMIDASRLPFRDNMRATAGVVEMAHARSVPVEAELGAVWGHESGPAPPYEELFSSGLGFTDADEAALFVEATQCDWLSVAIGNVHGAVASGLKDRKKVQARLNLQRLDQLFEAADIPLVLHGGSGIQQTCILRAMKKGIAKINVGTEIRQPYERVLKETGSLLKAQEAVYDRTVWVLRDHLEISGKAEMLIRTPHSPEGAPQSD